MNLRQPVVILSKYLIAVLGGAVLSVALCRVVDRGLVLSTRSDDIWLNDWFAVKHLRERLGETSTETLSFEYAEALDNSNGQTTTLVEIQLERGYRHRSDVSLHTSELALDDVRSKIAELYRLAKEQVATCAVPVAIPPGSKARVTLERTERWAEGKIVVGLDGADPAGTYQAFLVHDEHCALISQEYEA